MAQRVATLYIDDSGTRHPDHGGTETPQGYDWFALGGVYVREEDESSCRSMHAEFCEKWKIVDPLHSVKIRSRKGHFAWLGKLDKETYGSFMGEFGQLMTSLPVLGMACVIDRPGYNERYKSIYGKERWRLCKTAFSILVERAAKYAEEEGRKLNIFVEKSDKKTDGCIKGYFSSLKEKGMPFSADKSLDYSPLRAAELSGTLYDLRMKSKSSPMIQYADLYLYPICRGRYEPSYRPYCALSDAHRLIDSQVAPDQRSTHGIKYSCFELRDAQKK